MPTTRRGADSYPEQEQEQEQEQQQPAAPAEPAATAEDDQSPAAAAAGERAQQQHGSNFNTPAHRAARTAARMSEADYEALHACPDESFILRSLQDRMEAVAREQQNSFNQRRLEDELQRQNEISGSAAGGGRREHSPRDRPPKIPRALEFPAVPAAIVFKGTTDYRTVEDFKADWEQNALYVTDDFKCAHLLTALSDAVRNNLTAALKTTQFNDGAGYQQPQTAPTATILKWLAETYDKPDHLYRSIQRFHALKQRPDQSLEDFLRARDKMTNQLTRHGVMVDAQTSKTMLVSAVLEPIRLDLMREKAWFDMDEQAIIMSMKTKQLAVSTAGRNTHSRTAHHSGGQLYAATAQPRRHQMMAAATRQPAAKRQQLMVATAQRTPGGNVNNQNTNAPNRHQSFDREHYVLAMRDSPQPHQRQNYRRPGNQTRGPSVGHNRGPINRNRSYNLRQQQQQRLGLKHMRQYYHPSVWSQRVDERGRVRPTAAPYIPANRKLYSSDVDGQGRKFCIVCQKPHHDLTTCPVAHARWKQRLSQMSGA